MSRRRSSRHLHNLYQDLGIIILSVLVAVILSASGVLNLFTSSLDNAPLFGILLAGVLFTSVFTTAPAIVLLASFSFQYPIWFVAIWGTVGALLGDYVLFHFIRDHFSEDILSFLKQHKHKQWQKLLRLPSTRWLLAVLGMIIIASPLPDELGITLLGFAKTRKIAFVIISLLGNFFGILAVTWLSQRI